MKVRTINPATEQTLDEYEVMALDDINKAVVKARQAFKEWQNNIQKRAAFLYNVSHLFRKDKERLAKVITMEMGKPIKEAEIRG